MNDYTSTSLPGRKSRIGRYVGILFLFLLLIFGVYFYWRYYFTYSSGNRFGLLQKFSHKGNLFKTYEGEMILSSVRSNANVPLASEKFLFSVDRKSVANQLMNLQGKLITVHYKEKKGSLSWRGESKYIVDSVQTSE
ncbi:MAG TPA: hypothetical protein VM935_18965 [Chitinophagaceae bacterium]|jgi:hypothetical protein|nr:hypothetical protein [Chitinophagaceae bacterium]